MNELDMDAQEEKRPVFLTVLAVLSLVNIGWSFMTNMFSYLRGPMSEDQMEQYKADLSRSFIDLDNGGEGMQMLVDMKNNIMHMVEALNANHTMNVLSTCLVLILGAVGVVMMLRRRKLGFHLYILYSFFASTQLYLFVAPSFIINAVVILSLVLSGIFILLYAQNLKWLK